MVLVAYSLFICAALGAQSIPGKSGAGPTPESPLPAPDSRYALVIGNSHYNELPGLKNPGNDAEDMAAVLRSIGFDVNLLLDAGLEQMEDAVIKLGAQLSISSRSVGLFYYAGHGVQSEGINYLIPSDSRIQAESFLRSKTLSAQSVMDVLQSSRNRLNLVVLDACRDNPFGWARSGSRGLSVIGTQPSGSIVVYATSSGNVAQDGIGRNGVFTAELLKNLAVPGIEIMEVFSRTGAGVQSATAGKQTPAIYSQFFGKEYLAGGSPSIGGQKPSVLKTVDFLIASPSGQTAELVVAADRDDGEVFIDGVKVGNAPNLFQDIPVGKEILVEVRAGFFSAKKLVTLAAGETRELILTLERQKGRLYVRVVNPKSYTLVIDGESFGKLTESGLVGDVGAGEREIELVGYGLYWKGKITINAGQTTTVTATPWVDEEKAPVDMVFVKGGTFLMGSPASEQNRENDEGPQHKVILTSFEIGKCEVTVGEFRQFVVASGYKTAAESWSNRTWNNPGFVQTDRHPVTWVTWYDAIEFCNWRSDRDGLRRVYKIDGKSVTIDYSANGYRLPTEAEWEYAARGGSLSRGYLFSGSNDGDTVAWFSSNSGNSSHQVGTKAPNELGLYDMSGNAWEWCSDWYGPYSAETQKDPVGAFSGNNRVYRGGGSWWDTSVYLRSADRAANIPDLCTNTLGFRILRRP